MAVSEEFSNWNVLSPVGGVQEQNFEHVIEEVGMVTTGTDTVGREVHLQELWLHSRIGRCVPVPFQH